MNVTETHLTTVSNDGLITAMLALTYKIHAAEAERDKVEANVLREQRALIKAEILSRMEERLA